MCRVRRVRQQPAVGADSDCDAGGIECDDGADADGNGKRGGEFGVDAGWDSRAVQRELCIAAADAERWKRGGNGSRGVAGGGKRHADGQLYASGSQSGDICECDGERRGVGGGGCSGFAADDVRGRSGRLTAGVSGALGICPGAATCPSHIVEVVIDPDKIFTRIGRCHPGYDKVIRQGGGRRLRIVTQKLRANPVGSISREIGEDVSRNGFGNVPCRVCKQVNRRIDRTRGDGTSAARIINLANQDRPAKRSAMPVGLPRISEKSPAWNLQSGTV